LGDIIHGKWPVIQNRIRAKWTRLKEEDEPRGSDVNWIELSGRLQTIYGYTKEQAEAEIQKFQRSLKAD